MPPKKKGQTMSLSDFASLVETQAPASSNWADEDMELPSAPMGHMEESHQIGNAQYDRNFVRGTGDRRTQTGPPPPPVIDYARLPTTGPFSCFVGNLPFDATEQDIRACFPDVSITSISIPKDQEMRPRGFAYVHVADQDSLIKALLLSGAPLKGRYIRVDVSEGRPGGQQENTFASDWRGGVEHNVIERSGRPNFDRPDSAPRAPDRVFDRSMMSPVVAEHRPVAANAWRSTAAPVVSDRPKSTVSERSFRSATNSPAVSEPPKKPVLNLLPRSKPISAIPEPAKVYEGKPNPFGAAKPVEKPSTPAAKE